jgi:hypothetical protein
MDESQRIRLSNLINQYKTEETTDKIRELKHSEHIKNDVKKLMALKRKYPNIHSKEAYEKEAHQEGSFLFMHYPEIFNRFIADELDLTILSMLLDTLKDIEEDRLDQHEASYKVGQLLKRIYVDKVINEEDSHSYRKPTHDVSWENFKRTNK